MPDKDMYIAPFQGDAADIKPAKQLPVYLVTCCKGKTFVYFACNRLDKQSTFVEFDGCELQSPPTQETTDFQALIVRSKLQQLCVPWHRIHEIKMLTFRK